MLQQEEYDKRIDELASDVECLPDEIISSSESTWQVKIMPVLSTAMTLGIMTGGINLSMGKPLAGLFQLAYKYGYITGRADAAR